MRVCLMERSRANLENLMRPYQYKSETQVGLRRTPTKKESFVWRRADYGSKRIDTNTGPTHLDHRTTRTRIKQDRITKPIVDTKILMEMPTQRHSRTHTLNEPTNTRITNMRIKELVKTRTMRWRMREKHTTHTLTTRRELLTKALGSTANPREPPTTKAKERNATPRNTTTMEKMHIPLLTERRKREMIIMIPMNKKRLNPPIFEIGKMLNKMNGPIETRGKITSKRHRIYLACSIERRAHLRKITMKIGEREKPHPSAPRRMRSASSRKRSSCSRGTSAPAALR